MNTPLGRPLPGFRRYFAVQRWLWSRYLADLQPWEAEAAMRWVRNPVTRRWELRGGVLPPCPDESTQD
ncbi:hypothetical protein SAMN02982929_00642 [Saccharopolyspora kobensis]|uniref:Uncharacterized protein n=1 Tax=Saccharopolyspora kobensis TaxID=146035 RepID=A0A1H5USY8_9PSEU|nr:hypothetical protein [Saccharopolyspora kobensis]SEF78183.1 hypothetical protein SAMN02982929_00642 [Saccharopolyspora kobensis]SFC69616.1 hypothetical protein SAMN05216506_1011428 [Saccharopolyspora kobensis]